MNRGVAATRVAVTCSAAIGTDGVGRLHDGTIVRGVRGRGDSATVGRTRRPTINTDVGSDVGSRRREGGRWRRRGQRGRRSGASNGRQIDDHGRRRPRRTRPTTGRRLVVPLFLLGGGDAMHPVVPVLPRVPLPGGGAERQRDRAFAEPGGGTTSARPAGRPERRRIRRAGMRGGGVRGRGVSCLIFFSNIFYCSV